MRERARLEVETERLMGRMKELEATMAKAAASMQRQQHQHQHQR